MSFSDENTKRDREDFNSMRRQQHQHPTNNPSPTTSNKPKKKKNQPPEQQQLKKQTKQQSKQLNRYHPPQISSKLSSKSKQKPNQNQQQQNPNKQKNQQQQQPNPKSNKRAFQGKCLDTSKTNNNTNTNNTNNQNNASSKQQQQQPKEPNQPNKVNNTRKRKQPHNGSNDTNDSKTDRSNNSNNNKNNNNSNNNTTNVNKKRKTNNNNHSLSNTKRTDTKEMIYPPPLTTPRSNINHRWTPPPMPPISPPPAKLGKNYNNNNSSNTNSNNWPSYWTDSRQHSNDIIDRKPIPLGHYDQHNHYHHHQQPHYHHQQYHQYQQHNHHHQLQQPLQEQEQHQQHRSRYTGLNNHYSYQHHPTHRRHRDGKTYDYRRYSTSGSSSTTSNNKKQKNNKSNNKNNSNSSNNNISSNSNENNDRREKYEPQQQTNTNTATNLEHEDEVLPNTTNYTDNTTGNSIIDLRSFSSNEDCVSNNERQGNPIMNEESNSNNNPKDGVTSGSIVNNFTERIRESASLTDDDEDQDDDNEDQDDDDDDDDDDIEDDEQCPLIDNEEKKRRWDMDSHGNMSSGASVSGTIVSYYSVASLRTSAAAALMAVQLASKAAATDDSSYITRTSSTFVASSGTGSNKEATTTTGSSSSASTTVSVSSVQNSEPSPNMIDNVACDDPNQSIPTSIMVDTNQSNEYRMMPPSAPTTSPPVSPSRLSSKSTERLASAVTAAKEASEAANRAEMASARARAASEESLLLSPSSATKRRQLQSSSEQLDQNCTTGRETSDAAATAQAAIAAASAAMESAVSAEAAYQRARAASESSSSSKDRRSKPNNNKNDANSNSAVPMNTEKHSSTNHEPVINELQTHSSKENNTIGGSSNLIVPASSDAARAVNEVSRMNRSKGIESNSQQPDVESSIPSAVSTFEGSNKEVDDDETITIADSQLFTPTHQQIRINGQMSIEKTTITNPRIFPTNPKFSSNGRPIPSSLKPSSSVTNTPSALSQPGSSIHRKYSLDSNLIRPDNSNTNHPANNDEQNNQRARMENNAVNRSRSNSCNAVPQQGQMNEYEPYTDLTNSSSSNNNSGNIPPINEGPSRLASVTETKDYECETISSTSVAKSSSSSSSSSSASSTSSSSTSSSSASSSGSSIISVTSQAPLTEVRAPMTEIRIQSETIQATIPSTATNIVQNGRTSRKQPPVHTLPSGQTFDSTHGPSRMVLPGGRMERNNNHGHSRYGTGKTFASIPRGANGHLRLPSYYNPPCRTAISNDTESTNSNPYKSVASMPKITTNSTVAIAKISPHSTTRSLSTLSHKSESSDMHESDALEANKMVSSLSTLWKKRRRTSKDIGSKDKNKDSTGINGDKSDSDNESNYGKTPAQAGTADSDDEYGEQMLVSASSCLARQAASLTHLRAPLYPSSGRVRTDFDDDCDLEYSVGRTRQQLNKHLGYLNLTAAFGCGSISSRKDMISHITLSSAWNYLPQNRNEILEWWLEEGIKRLGNAILLDPKQCKQRSIPVFWTRPNCHNQEHTKLFGGGELCHYIGHYRCIAFYRIEERSNFIKFRDKYRQAVLEFQFDRYSERLHHRIAKIPG